MSSLEVVRQDMSSYGVAESMVPIRSSRIELTRVALSRCVTEL